MKEIWWIRHGESMANANQRTATDKDNPLTEKGWAEAALVARAIPRPPNRVILSPYIRTHQTAQATLERFAGVAVEEWPIQEYTWLASTRRANTNITERQEMARKFFARLDPLAVDGPGAESFAEFIDRVDQARHRLYTVADDFTLIFCHAGFIRALMLSLLSPGQGTDPDYFERFMRFERTIRFPNTAILKLWTDGHSLRMEGPNTAHLQQAEVWPESQH